MKAPYRITRNTHGEGYEFILYHINEDEVWISVEVAYSRSPIAPEWLRAEQGRLNTKALLD